MAASRFGLRAMKVNGDVYNVKGSIAYNLGRPLREGVAGADRVHGYTEKPQVPYMEGEISDTSDLRLKNILEITGATVTAELLNGKVIVLRDAWFAGEGVGNTEEGNIAFRFEGMAAEEIS